MVVNEIEKCTYFVDEMDLRMRTGDFEIYVLQFHGHYHIRSRWPDNQLAGLWTKLSGFELSPGSLHCLFNLASCFTLTVLFSTQVHGCRVQKRRLGSRECYIGR